MKTVLVVDDSATILEIIRQILLNEGYMVVLATDGRKALEAAARSQDPIGLLITDVTLSGTSCILMVERLRDQCPRLKVLFVSGHTEDVVAELGVPSDAFFLQKPFSAVQLAYYVRGVLDGQRQGLKQCVASSG
jgi:DNA-binding response OmpR family regulator